MEAGAASLASTRFTNLHWLKTKPLWTHMTANFAASPLTDQNYAPSLLLPGLWGSRRLGKESGILSRAQNRLPRFCSLRCRQGCLRKADGHPLKPDGFVGRSLPWRGHSHTSTLLRHHNDNLFHPSSKHHCSARCHTVQLAAFRRRSAEYFPPALITGCMIPAGTSTHSPRISNY